jgi:hypothetical protein
MKYYLIELKKEALSQTIKNEILSHKVEKWSIVANWKNEVLLQS